MAPLASAALDLPPMPESASWPRLMTGRHPRAVGTYGPAVADWALAHPHLHPRQLQAVRWWQLVGLYRALEHDDQGRLVWETVLISGPRQTGKSYLERIVCAWRLHQADHFGGPQDVLHVAHKLVAAQEVWRPAARWAIEHYGKRAVRWANGEQQLELPDGSRWMIQAANDGAGVSFSLPMVLVDEAWSVNRTVVDAALAPTQAEAEQPQLWLVSTAGTAASELMNGYRALALGLDDPQPTDSLLMLEWSAPPDPDLDIDDPHVWRSATPHWDDRRAARVAKARAEVDELEFRHQWLNQWVPQLSPPMFDAGAWPAARWDGPLPGGPVSFGVDVSGDRSASWIVAMAQGVAEVVDTRPGPPTWVPARLAELYESWRPSAIAVDRTGPAATVADQLEGDARSVLLELNTRELSMACGQTFDAITDGRLWARGHVDLDRAVANAHRRAVGQSWVFARQVGDVSCSPLLAMVLALWASEHAPESVEVSAIW